MPSSDDTRHHIVQSLFAKTDENGTVEETLISYVKVFEDESGAGAPAEQKTRYLMLAGELQLARICLAFTIYFARTGFYHSVSLGWRGLSDSDGHYSERGQ